MSQQLLVKSKVSGWVVTKNINQLLYSTKFDENVWIPTSMTLTSGQSDPASGTNAFRLTATAANATIVQPLLLNGGEMNRVFSIYIKRITGTGNIGISVDGTTFETVTISGAWVRYDTTLPAGGAAYVMVRISTNADAIDVYGAQLEDGVSPTAYVGNLANRYTVTQISDPDYPANTVRGTAFLDGRFFVMTPAGEIYQSALEDALNWSALEFIQSQNDPSKGIYLAKVQNYIVAFKDWSTEFFYDAANPVGSILSPVQSASIQIGCASDGSVQDVNGTLMFMGQTRAGFGRSIYMLQGTTPQKVSTPDVEKIMNQDDLAEVHSWQAQVGAHQLYGITMVTSGVTLVYDLTFQTWSFFTYLETSGSLGTVTAVSATGVVTATAHPFSDGDIVKITGSSSDFNGWHVVTDVATNTFQIQAAGTAWTGSATAEKYNETFFPVVASIRSNGRQYMQDRTSGSLYELDANYYQDAVGAIAARIRTPRIDDGTAELKVMGQAEIIGDKIPSIAVVRYSDDDYQTYSKFRPVDLSLQRSRIRRLGYYTRRSFEILHVRNANLRISGLDIT